MEHHRTLRATIQWSYDLLTPSEQLLFERLAVFAGPFDLDAAEIVTAGADLDPIDVDALLGDLVERSLLTVESGPFGRRFRLLDTMRQFAAEHLEHRGDTGDRRLAERILAMTPPDDQDLTVFWLTWAAFRFMQSGDRDAHERLVRRHEEPDHPLVRFARAYLYEDGEALVEWSPEAVAELRRRSDDHGAVLTELAGMASGLLSTGQFGEFDALVSARADRYRAHGPPTFLSLTLVGLAYSALFQGKLDQADRYFDELAGVDVPERTVSVAAPVAARAAFRRGNRTQAFRILRAHSDDLLETDNLDIARLACIEFVNMMAAVDRLPDAARILGHLESTGNFGALAFETVVAGATEAVAASTDPTVRHAQATGRDLDVRQALVSMRDVLDELAGDRQITL